jgi:hypothetical protein
MTRNPYQQDEPAFPIEVPPQGGDCPVWAYPYVLQREVNADGSPTVPPWPLPPPPWYDDPYDGWSQYYGP